MIKLNLKSLAKAVIAFTIVCGSFLLINHPVSALSAEVQKKQTLEAFDTCYYFDYLELTVDQSEYHYSDYLHEFSVVTKEGKSNSVPLITGLYTYDTATCLDVMIGSDWIIHTNGQYPGLPGLGHSPAPNSNNEETLTNYMTSIGYIKKEENNGDVVVDCFSLPYEVKIADVGALYTNYLCFKHEKNSNIATEIFREDYKNPDRQIDSAWFKGPKTDSDGKKELAFKMINWKVAMENPFVDCEDLPDWVCETKTRYVYLERSDDGTGWVMDINKEGYSSGITGIAEYFYEKAARFGEVTSGRNIVAKYKPGRPEYYEGIVDYGKVANKYIKERDGDVHPIYDRGVLAGYSGWRALAFTGEEEFDLYSYYFKEYYDSGDIVCTKDSARQAYYEGQSDIYKKFMITDNSGKKPCYVHVPKKNKNKSVNGLDDKKHFLEKVTFSDMIKSMDGLVVKREIPDPGSGSAVDPEDPTNPSNPNTQLTPREQQEQACYREAGSLGWIICPMVFGIQDVVNGIYEDKIEPLMRTHASVIEQLRDENSSLHKSWVIFRDIANVLFVVLFMMVIFSQITGVGIDNYGIKKTLPKLIIAAILVNLSYILCAFVVDAVNLVGKGVYQLFTNMGDGVAIMDGAQNLLTECPSGTCGVSGGASFVTAIVEIMIVALTGTIAVLDIAAAGWLAVIPILLLLLSAIVSVFFLLVVLGLRQALIMLMIILAPVAVVLYALPNTGQTFKKYINIFSQLLMAYPMASILIGSGYFGSRLLLSTNTNSVAMYIVAGLISIVPYFFIPSLVTNSLRAFGNIGNAIRGFGQRANHQTQGRLDRGIRGSQMARDYQDRRMDRFQDRRMNRDLDAARPGSLMSRVARRDASGNIMRHADGTVILDDDKLRRLSNSEKKRLMAAQSRMRENGTMDARLVSGGHRISESSMAAQAAQYRASDAAQEVKDQEAQIMGGTFEYVDGAGRSHVVDSNNIGSMEAALESELMKDGSEVNTSRIKALQNVLSGRGDKGRTAVGNAMVAAQTAGVVSDVARQAYSENITQNWGSDYKENSRSTWNFAQANAASQLPVIVSTAPYF